MRRRTAALVVAFYEPGGSATCEHREHTEIVEFIAKGDAEAANAAMEAHLRSLESRIKLDQPPPARSLGGDAQARMKGAEFGRGSGRLPRLCAPSRGD